MDILTTTVGKELIGGTKSTKGQKVRNTKKVSLRLKRKEKKSKGITYTKYV
jgi:hypothetical protein